MQRWWLGMTAVAVASAASGQVAKRPVRSIDDLPRFSYPFRGSVQQLIERPALLAPLAIKAKADVEAELAGYVIEDRATLRGLHDALLSIAMLERDYPAVRREVATLRALADKPLQRTTADQFQLDVADASATAAPGTPAFAATYRRIASARLNRLPWSLYGDAARENVGHDATMSAALLIGGNAPLYQPQVDAGAALDEVALRAIIRTAVFVRDLVPLKPQLLSTDRAYLVMHQRPKPDIWPARAIALPATGLTPVVVAIWDGGTDVAVYPGQTWINPKEVVDGRDDDGNGYVDDVHGIATDRFGARQVSLLAEVPADLGMSVADVTTLAIGMRDQSGNFDTPAARQVVRFFDTADVPAVARFWTNMDWFGEYYHGTHVAGIVAQDDPAVRIMVVKHSFDWRTPPFRPTEATARAHAQAYLDQVAYMKAAGVRLANMSWTVDLKTEYEEPLAANGVPEAERGAEARRLFAIEAEGLKRAIESAPEILFVCAAGNSNNSATFQAAVPASLDLPNVLTVAAVGQDGVPTSFTTTGPSVDIAANGFEVMSFAPGGARMRSSGTSMASPNVVNAAAKLLAVRPTLTVAALRALLLDTATRGQGDLRLLNGRAAMAMLTAR